MHDPISKLRNKGGISTAEPPARIPNTMSVIILGIRKSRTQNFVLMFHVSQVHIFVCHNICQYIYTVSWIGVQFLGGGGRSLFQNVKKVALGPNSSLMNSGDSLPINKAATACTNSYPCHGIWCAESSNFSSRHLACTNAHNKCVHTCSFSMRNKMRQVHLLMTTKN